jgi:hypothetical protein
MTEIEFPPQFLWIGHVESPPQTLFPLLKTLGLLSFQPMALTNCFIKNPRSHSQKPKKTAHAPSQTTHSVASMTNQTWDIVSVAFPMWRLS